MSKKNVIYIVGCVVLALGFIFWPSQDQCANAQCIPFDCRVCVQQRKYNSGNNLVSQSRGWCSDTIGAWTRVAGSSQFYTGNESGIDDNYWHTAARIRMDCNSSN